MPYVHILLFACPGCNFPVVTERVTEEKNLENVDRESLKIKCSYCGLESGAIAIDARKHIVEEWRE
jgi:hypothetical protein